MASPEAYDIISAYLVSEFTSAPLTFENDDFKLPDDPEHFVRIEIFGDFYQQESIGAEEVAANLWREAGVVLAHVMAPQGAGSRQARTYAKQICDLFRGQEIGGIMFRDMSIGSSEAANIDGSYYRMTATINWLKDS